MGTFPEGCNSIQRTGLIANGMLSAIGLPLILLMMMRPVEGGGYELHQPADKISAPAASHTTNNGCTSFYCARGKTCTLRNYVPVCACVDYCPLHFKPVCGSDGMIYPNHCHLHRRACWDHRRVNISPMQFCRSPQHQNLLTDPQTQAGLDSEKMKSHDDLLATIWNNQSRNDIIIDPPKAGNNTGGPTTQSSTNHMTDITTGSQLHPPESAEISSIDVRVISDRVQIHGRREQPQLEHICSLQRHRTFKDNLLGYSRLQTQREANRVLSREFLISKMFSQYDINNDAVLDATELANVTHRLQLSDLAPGCDLTDLLHFDDSTLDGRIDINEFYLAFNRLYDIAVVSLDKALEFNSLSAQVGDNVEIRCDITGSPSPDIVWYRSGKDLADLKDDQLQVFSDGSLYLSRIALVHGSRYQCRARDNEQVVQTHLLHVQTPPIAKVESSDIYCSLGEVCQMQCETTGHPTPQLFWLKNGSPIGTRPDMYDVTIDGGRLRIGPITDESYSGKYTCQAKNAAGTSQASTRLLLQTSEHMRQLRLQFAIFHQYGISMYDAQSCRLQHEILGSDILPGKQVDYVCGGLRHNCSWGEVVTVGDSFIYASQPLLNRVVLLDVHSLTMIDVIHTDEFPVQVRYIPLQDQIWILNWRSTEDRGIRTIQVVRNASSSTHHYTVHLQPINDHLDLVQDMLLPAVQAADVDLHDVYVTHSNHRGMYKVDIQTHNFVKSIDLSSYNCVPRHAEFSEYHGFVVIGCMSPVTSLASGQLLFDRLTDTVIQFEPRLLGRPFLSPDSVDCVTIYNPHDVTKLVAGDATTITVQRITGSGLEFKYDLRTLLHIIDATFHRNGRSSGYLMYATVGNRADIFVLDLQTGKVDIMAGMSQNEALQVNWNRPSRPISSAGGFSPYIATTSSQTLYIADGDQRAVNCQIAGLEGLVASLWIHVNL